MGYCSWLDILVKISDLSRTRKRQGNINDRRNKLDRRIPKTAKSI